MRYASLSLSMLAGVSLNACRGPVTSSSGSAQATSSATVEGTSESTVSVGTSDAQATDSTSGTSVATSTSDTSGPQSTSGDCGFLDCKDMGSACGPEDSLCCDVWAQDCPGNQKCVAFIDEGNHWSLTRCVPLVGEPDMIGEPCSTINNGELFGDSCEFGAMCWFLSLGNGPGVCVPQCKPPQQECLSGGASCCPVGQLCASDSLGVVNVCLETCFPADSACKPGYECMEYRWGFFCFPDRKGLDTPAGGSCLISADCAPGLFCGGPSTYPGCPLGEPGCCIPFCDLSDPECAEMTECTPYFPGPAPDGFENLGACRLP